MIDEIDVLWFVLWFHEFERAMRTMIRWWMNVCVAVCVRIDGAAMGCVDRNRW